MKLLKNTDLDLTLIKIIKKIIYHNFGLDCCSDFSICESGLVPDFIHTRFRNFAVWHLIDKLNCLLGPKKSKVGFLQILRA